MAVSKLQRFRTHKDDYFAHGEHSPLTDDQRVSFHGLDYFPENPELSFNVPLDTSGPGAGELILVETTDGQTDEFIRSGWIAVSASGEPVRLAVLKDPTRGRFFLPFRDSTAGIETYSLGRYLDPQERPDGTLVVDFNYAYNPYCAYGEGWSCPIPPVENVVPVKIEAGERTFGRASQASEPNGGV